jgi:hypothetical protein
MSFHPWADFLKFASPRRRPARSRPRCACRQPARSRLSLEALEDRTVPSGTPLPIPGLLFNPPAPANPFGGPAIHSGFPGPADNTTPSIPTVGGEPSTITNFNGFVGVAHVEGTGADNSGNTLFWDVDMRFMKGVFQLSDGSIQKGACAFL